MWKSTWRRWARHAGLSEAASRRMADQVDDWLSKDVTVAAFHALPGEPLLQSIFDERRRWLLPRVDGDHMTFHEWPTELEQIAFGLWQPTAGSPEVPPAEIDVMIIPGLAYDRRGVRLGRGAGYYDRFLAKHRAPVTVGVIEARRFVERLPRVDHDEPVDLVITEAGPQSLGR